MRATALILVALAGCAGNDLVKPTRENREFALNVKFMDSAEVLRTCTSLGLWQGKTIRVGQLLGCATFDPTKRICTVIAERPVMIDDERTRTLGHEVSHCVWGLYHD